MARPPNAIPLKPDYAARSRATSASVVRAVLAVANTGRYRNPAETLERHWPGDTVARQILTRAEAEPAMTSTSNWVDTLAPTVTSEFIGSLGPISAAAKLIGAGVTVPLIGESSVLIPKRVGGKPASDVSWIAEGAPIGVRQSSLDTATVGPPRKLGAIVVCSNELIRQNAEAALALIVREDIAASLDASLFDDTAADTTRPAGLRNGLSPLTVSTATDLSQSMREDLFTLAAAVVDAGGSGDGLVYVANGRQAQFIDKFYDNPRPLTVWPSVGLDDGDILCIQVDAFASGFGSEPRIELASEGVVHMASPALPISDGGVVADPTFSLWQQDLTAIRVILNCAWTLRGPLIATISGVSWGVAAA